MKIILLSIMLFISASGFAQLSVVDSTTGIKYFIDSSGAYVIAETVDNKQLWKTKISDGKGTAMMSISFSADENILLIIGREEIIVAKSSGNLYRLARY